MKRDIVKSIRKLDSKAFPASEQSISISAIDHQYTISMSISIEMNDLE